MLSKRLIKSNDAGGGQVCRNIVDDYKPFSGGIALYQLNGNANDVSGNYNGTASNVTYGTGKFGQAGIFNGSSSRVSIPNIVNQAADHSVSLWVKPINLNSNRGALSMFNGSHLLVYLTTDGGLNSQGASSSAGSTVGTINVNDWNNIVFTYNYATTTYTMYVNGVNRGNDTNFNFSGRPNSIGCHNNGSSFIDYFLGDIDQVRIFDRALNPTEVSELYAEQVCYAACASDEPDIFQDGSGVALYQLNWDGS